MVEEVIERDETKLWKARTMWVNLQWRQNCGAVGFDGDKTRKELCMHGK